jgi:predicted Zn-dependent protease
MLGETANKRMNPLVYVALALNIVLGIAFLTVIVASTLRDRDTADDTPSANPPSANNQHIPVDDLPAPDPGGVEQYYVASAAWDHNPVTYTILNCPSSMDCGEAQTTVREAMAEWESVSGLTLIEVPAGGDIEVSWGRGAESGPYAFDGPGGMLAKATLPLPYLGAYAGNVYLDDDENWVGHAPTAPYPQQVYLKSSVMHEIGHALGLNHSEQPEALMWASYAGVRGLSADDVAAIQSLYGGPQVAEQPAP